MAEEKSSSHSSSPKNIFSAIDYKHLLLYYQRKEDKYKEEMDKHLKNLVADRRNEELHTNIRELLAMSHQKDLRDKIIYILKDPTVEIGYRTGFPTTSKFSSSETLANKKFKEELEYLQNQLDEVISKSKSDILEDCKQALEKSKEKIMQDEIQIRELQKKLQDINAKKNSSLKTLPTESQLVEQASSADTFSNVCSHLKDIHFSLILLLKVVSNTPTDMQHIVENNILQLESCLCRCTSCLCRCTRLTFDINNMHKSLIKYISNNRKSIQNVNVSELRSELKHFEEMLKEMTILTAENELLNVGLKRTSFFNALRDSSVCIQEDDRMQHLNDFKSIISKCDTLHKTASRAADFVESVQKYNSKRDYWSKFADLPQEFSSPSVDSLRERPSIRKTAKFDSELVSLRQAKSDTLKDLEKLLGIYKRTVQEAENLGFGQSTEAKLLAEKLKATQKELEEMLENLINLLISLNVKKNLMRSEEQQIDLKSSDYEEILRKINETLSKVKLVQKAGRKCE